MIEVITHANYSQLTFNQQTQLLDRLCLGGKCDSNKKSRSMTAPNWIPAMQCNFPFPIWANSKFMVTVHSDNILNGELEYTDTVQLRMRWTGYASQLYDGQIKLCAQNKDAKITGILNGEKFIFEKAELVTGQWPGCLCLYDKH